MTAFPIPVVAADARANPTDGEAPLQYMAMPQGMATFAAPQLPAGASAVQRAAATQVLRSLVDQMRARRFGVDEPPRIDLQAIDPAVVALVNDALGQGEVSALAQVPQPLRVQETGFAGVWRVQYPQGDGNGHVRHDLDRRAGNDGLRCDLIEAGAMPAAVRAAALAVATAADAPPATPPGADLMNGPALLHELLDASRRYREGDPAHIVNLTLVPVTPGDLEHLRLGLGAGAVALLSRGYGNCRISSTAIANVWWVQYFNSMDQLILNTIEVVGMPEVALAAPEDYADSIERLDEWLDVLAEPD